MSLFTGEENPARFIYLGAGFRVVRTFGVLLKELCDDENTYHFGYRCPRR